MEVAFVVFTLARGPHGRSFATVPPKMMSLWWSSLARVVGLGLCVFKALGSYDHCWPCPRSSTHGCARLSTNTNDLTGGDGTITTQLTMTSSLTACRPRSHAHITQYHRVPVAQAWEFAKVALSCHVALDMLCQGMNKAWLLGVLTKMLAVTA